ncbi:MAG: hypothetical protein HDS91_05260 [Bacteroidales bacterium]|nr:hypothetical protein [Bacteroidales bacterium]
MDIELYTLCEYAANSNGSLTIINTLDTIKAQQFPWRAYFGVAVKARIVSPLIENTTMSFLIFKEDAPDEILFSTSSPFGNSVGRFVAAGNIKGLLLHSPGKYCFRISIGDCIRKDYPFDVVIEKTNSSEIK